MPNVSNPLYSGLKLAAILVAAAVATGCVSAKSTPTEAAVAPAEPAPAPAPAPAPTPTLVQPAAPAVNIPTPDPLRSWTVVAGDHLWGIAGVWEVFNVPEKWPLLYKANLDQIEDADLIYPGQVLNIPRDSSLSEVEAAIQHAKNRGAWAVGPVELSDQEYLKSSP